MKKSGYLIFAAALAWFMSPMTSSAVDYDHIQTAAASQEDQQKSSLFKTVTPTQAKELMASRDDLLVVDVRNADELKNGIIEGSTLIPLWDIVKGKRGLPQDRPVMLICAVGGRSLALGKLLSANGYPEVYNLKGGVDAWKKSGLPVRY